MTEQQCTRFWNHVQKTDGCWQWIAGKMHAEGLVQRELGRLFGVSYVSIGKIVRRESWAHVL